MVNGKSWVGKDKAAVVTDCPRDCWRNCGNTKQQSHGTLKHSPSTIGCSSAVSVHCSEWVCEWLEAWVGDRHRNTSNEWRWWATVIGTRQMSGVGGRPPQEHVKWVALVGDRHRNTSNQWRTLKWQIGLFTALCTHVCSLTAILIAVTVWTRNGNTASTDVTRCADDTNKLNWQRQYWQYN
jgi:hypothetical protein